MEYTYLNQIDSPEDLKKLKPAELPRLVDELRDFIIEEVSKNGGHLGAGLGVVELTVALHFVLKTPSDNLIWDVGHQAYGHKILTGRRDLFSGNRKLGGISGFPVREESNYDAFGTGHSSTSVSAILGMALAARAKGESEKKHVAVIGDASMQAGMAFEAMNHAGDTDLDMLVILNDNRMSIDPGVGALNTYLFEKSSEQFRDVDTLMTKHSEDRDNIFEALNFKYFGPVDGHDVVELSKVLPRVLAESGPKLLHVITKKGKGYAPAEVGNATKWHAPGLFDKDTGSAIVFGRQSKLPKFQDVFGRVMTELASVDNRIYAITPAMPTGSGLTTMQESFPERTIDVGIAEQHALTFAAGLSAEGLIPVVAIYSTFLQRAYDQLIHDITIQRLKVILAIDRAGLVGADGSTHHGAFDIPMLRILPNTKIWIPGTERELEAMLKAAVASDHQGPIAIRYPRGRVPEVRNEGSVANVTAPLTLRKGSELLVVSTGPVRYQVERSIDLLGSSEVAKIGHVSLRSIENINKEELIGKHLEPKYVVTVEDGAVKGGLFGAVSEVLGRSGYSGHIYGLGIPDKVIKHGSQEELRELSGYGLNAIRKCLVELLG